MLKENLPILEEVNLDKWHAAGYTGKDVTIALLDSKCKPRELMKDFHKDVLGTEKEIGHGTNVGYTAYVAGPGVRVLAFNHSWHSDEAYNWIKDHKDEIDLINVSLAGIAGMPAPAFLKYEELGIPMICASGNDGYEDRVSYPANYDFTISIGAWNWRDKGAFSNDVAGYSNGGTDQDAVAPSGIHMITDEGYIFSQDGTSFAAPFACGMLACYIQLRKEKGYPKMAPEEVRSFIHKNAVDVREPGFDNKSGWGLFTMPSEIPVLEAIKKPVAEIPVKEPAAKKAATKKNDVPPIYKVRNKNSVAGLSKKYGVSKDNLRKWNDLKNDKLLVGRYIFLVDPDEVAKMLE